MKKRLITHPDDRAIVATFFGALALGLFHAVAPATDTSSVTLARQGDTAIVIDTLTNSSTLSEIGAADSNSPLPESTVSLGARDTALMNSLRVGGSSFPAVVPADIEVLRRSSLIVPVAGVPVEKLVDTFDAARGGSRRHNALDIMVARNTPVISVDRTQRYIFLYGHLDSYRPGLWDGATVKRGEIFGFVGTTGNANPAGSHLHFAIARSDNMKDWWKGTPLNPFLVYRGK